MVVVDRHEVLGQREPTEIRAADRAPSILRSEHPAKRIWCDPVFLRPAPQQSIKSAACSRAVHRATGRLHPLHDIAAADLAENLELIPVRHAATVIFRRGQWNSTFVL